MQLEARTERLSIRLARLEDAHSMRDYYERNRTHLAAWEPTREDSFYSLDFWQQSTEESFELAQQDLGYRFVAEHPAQEGTDIVGVCNLSNVVRGVFQACNLGYSIDAQYEGQGLAGEMVAAVVGLAFDQLKLHRVMANYIPANERSGKLLTALGFEREGLARDYLFIDGRWQDHVLTAKVNPDLSS